MYCQRCGSRCRQVHKTTVRRGRDLPPFEHRVVLLVPRWRVWCEQCGGPQRERPSWLSRHCRVTDRLADACSQRLRAASVQAVAAFYGLGWHEVKAMDNARLGAKIQAPDWTQIHFLAMDVFCLHKGYRDATVVIYPMRREVPWIGQGRSRATATTSIPAEGCAPGRAAVSAGPGQRH